MDLLLQSPVREYSDPAEVEAWLNRLQELRKRYAAYADALAQIEREETKAQDVLARARLREKLKS